MKKTSVFKLTNDNWHGSYTIDGWFNGHKNTMLVNLKWLGNILPKGPTPVYRVCIWGNDDVGMEKDFASEQDGYECFLQLLQLDYIDQTTLLEMQFSWA